MLTFANPPPGYLDERSSETFRPRPKETHEPARGDNYPAAREPGLDLRPLHEPLRPDVPGQRLRPLGRALPARNRAAAPRGRARAGRGLRDGAADARLSARARAAGGHRLHRPLDAFAPDGAEGRAEAPEGAAPPGRLRAVERARAPLRRRDLRPRPDERGARIPSPARGAGRAVARAHAGRPPPFRPRQAVAPDDPARSHVPFQGASARRGRRGDAPLLPRPRTPPLPALRAHRLDEIARPRAKALKLLEPVCKVAAPEGRSFCKQALITHHLTLITTLINSLATVGMMSRSLAKSVVKVTRTRRRPSGSS